MEYVSMRRGGTATFRVSGSGSRVGGKSVARRAEMHMQYDQYGRGDTVSFVGSRLNLKPSRVFGSRMRNKYDVYGMRLSCSRLLGTFRTSSSGIARPIMQHDKYMEDGTDTQRTRIYGIICTAYAYFRFSSRSESRVDSSVAAGSVSHHA